MHYPLKNQRTKVPTNVGRSILIRQLVLEERKDLTGVGTINISLFKKDKFLGHVRIKLFDKGQNFLVRAWFLSTKLVARKGEDLEASRVVFVVELG